MKKLFFLSAFAASMMLTSCVTTTKTARTESIPYSMYNANAADLQVGDRVTYELKPSHSVRKGGLSNCKQAAIQECLAQNGNADLLVEPQFVINMKRTLFGVKVASVTVTGRPAKYVNFRSLNDNVWTDPVFRGVKGATYNINQIK